MILIENIGELTPDCLNDVYRDFANYLGMDMAFKLYKHYKGLQITFPQRFLSRDYVRKQVLVEYDGVNSRIELAFFLTVFWAVLTRGKRAILTLF